MGAGASIDAISKVDGELARILGASNNDLAAAADKATRDIEHLVPKTASGQFDPTRGDRDAVREVVERAKRLAAYGYAVSWEYYKRTDVEELLADTSRLSDDFTPDEDDPTQQTRVLTYMGLSLLPIIGLVPFFAGRDFVPADPSLYS